MLLTDVLFALLSAMIVVVGPLNCLQVPLPDVGILALSLKVSCKHRILSAPAAAGVTAWYTVTTAVSLYMPEHTPLCTNTLYQMVAVRLL